MEKNKVLRDCWLEINLDNLKHNFFEMKKYVKPETQIMAVVKANAYGHGIERCGEILKECKADILGVGSLEDGIKLRKNNIRIPILVFASNTIKEVAEVYIENGLIPTILTYDQAKAISDLSTDKPYPIYLKMDTGRGRIGVNAEEMIEFVKKIKKLPNIELSGIYSHMADANWSDISSEYSLWQYDRFKNLVEQLNDHEIDVPFLQLANSAGLVAYPDIHLKGVAPGGSLWGYSALDLRDGKPELKNVLVGWKSRLIHTNEVIGGKFGKDNKAVKLKEPKRIGVMVGGLSDGIDHRQGFGGEVIIRGKRLPVICGMSIEHSIIDLTDCPEASVGDEVVILGRQGNEEITMNDICNLWQRTPLEFLTSLSHNLARIYIKENKVYDIV